MRAHTHESSIPGADWTLLALTPVQAGELATEISEEEKVIWTGLPARCVQRACQK